ncbi:MAG: GDSL family lipase [Ruminococcaceae bacterium]|nr:GDSL family lipase [Oscillospiraceae bacterium]
MKILFQGDSITDAGRDYSNFHDMGEGYPKYATAMLIDSYPDIDFEFINLGISGHRTENLLERLESDFIDIQPDIVSILIGVNDIWHRYLVPPINTSYEQTAENYRKILTAIKEKTNAKIFMIQPFLIGLDWLRPELEELKKTVDGLAEEFADVYLRLDEIFLADEQWQKDNSFYSDDGVHPNSNGSCFIGEQYFKALSPLAESLTND